MANRDPQGRYLPEHNLPGPGRTRSYDPSMDHAAAKLALLGLTDEEMAEFFGVNVATYYRWRKAHPAFCEAIRSGKVMADAEVAASLYRRAVGEQVTTQKIVKGDNDTYEIVTLTQRLPGDVSAAKHWLGNRQRGRWTNADEALPAETRDHLRNEEALAAAKQKLREEIARLDMIESAI